MNWLPSDMFTIMVKTSGTHIQTVKYCTTVLIATSLFLFVASSSHIFFLFWFSKYVFSQNDGLTYSYKYSTAVKNGARTQFKATKFPAGGTSKTLVWDIGLCFEYFLQEEIWSQKELQNRSNNKSGLHFMLFVCMCVCLPTRNIFFYKNPFE